MISVFLVALAGTIVAQITPGPNLLAVASVALGQGRAAALCVAAGVASGVLIWVAAFAFGISAVFQNYPAAGVVLQLAGGCYFLFLGAKAVRTARRTPDQTLKVSAEKTSLHGAYRRGILVVLTNPKAAMMWAAVTAFLSGAGLSPMGVMSFAPIGATSALIVYSSYAVLFSTPAAIRAYDKISRQIEFVFGALFSLLGINFILGGLRALRG